MRKRIKKKKFKQFQKQFCEPPYYGKKYAEWQCPKCGWSALQADDDYNMGKTKCYRIGYFGDREWEIEYKCPVCGTVFSFVDGT